MAYAVRRDIGSAPVRNRVRRRLRALMREHEGDLDVGHAYLVSAGQGAQDLTFRQLDRSLSEILRGVASEQGSKR